MGDPPTPCSPPQRRTRRTGLHRASHHKNKRDGMQVGVDRLDHLFGCVRRCVLERIFGTKVRSRLYLSGLESL